MAKRRRRRNWGDDEKRMICAQTRVFGVSVSQVARRYDVNANQVFNWLKEPRFADAEPLEAETAFLPVEIMQARDMTVQGTVLFKTISMRICGLISQHHKAMQRRLKLGSH